LQDSFGGCVGTGFGGCCVVVAVGVDVGLVGVVTGVGVGVGFGVGFVVGAGVGEVCVVVTGGVSKGFDAPPQRSVFEAV
jgi:hypothetical protein